ncbi:MAG: hypothetical protein PHT12_03065 [Patescibacteria group bacterium]|nr:hypothetical protein [Patescibacteria group bacterium]
MGSLPSFFPGTEPKFEVGQSVWVIRQKGPREFYVREVTVLAVRLALLEGCGDEQRQGILTTGYDLAIYREGTFDQTFAVGEVYGSQAEAARLAVWRSVAEVEDRVWLTALGKNSSKCGRCELRPDDDGAVCMIRRILFKARREEGMLQRDAEDLAELIGRAVKQVHLGRTPNLDLILSRLGLAWPRE